LPNPSQPFAVQSISDNVYLALKKDIMEGALQPGARLVVLDIAGRYAISQAPVREALERLKQEGLIVGQANKGSVVSEISAKEIRDIFVLREMIEGYAVKQSMKSLREEDYERLEELLTQLEEAVNASDSIAILEKDLEFHGYFYMKCDNGAVMELWSRMKSKIMRFMAISNRHYSTDKLVAWHRLLVEALRTGDEEEAERQFIEHIHAYKIIEWK
jgi:DNA-binding GntR family transcriptional regulator